MGSVDRQDLSEKTPLAYTDKNRYNFVNDVIKEVQGEVNNNINDMEEYYVDEEGQLSFINPEEVFTNYLPVASDYEKIPNKFIERLGPVSYLANLGMMLAVTRVEKRNKADFADTAEGLWLQQIYKETGTDYSDGLVAKIPIKQFIDLYGLNKGGRTYQEIDALYNSAFLASQWTIITEQKDYSATTNVLTGTMYNKVDKCMYLKFNSDLEETLTVYKANYSMLPLPVLGKLREDSIVNLYQILKKRFEIEKQKNIKYGYGPKEEIKITIDYNHLLFLLNVYPVDVTSSDKDMAKVVDLLRHGQYETAAQVVIDRNLISKFDYQKTKKAAAVSSGKFKERILDRAFKMINGFKMIKNLDKEACTGFDEAFATYLDLCKDNYPTDIHFRYQALKSGKGGKPSSYVFYVMSAQAASDTETTNEREQKTLKPSQKRTLRWALDLLGDRLTEDEIILLLEKAEWEEELLEEAYEAEKEYEENGNNPKFLNWMIKAVEGGWKPNRKE